MSVDHRNMEFVLLATNPSVSLGKLLSLPEAQTPQTPQENGSLRHSIQVILSRVSRGEAHDGPLPHVSHSLGHSKLGNAAEGNFPFDHISFYDSIVILFSSTSVFFRGTLSTSLLTTGCCSLPKSVHHHDGRKEAQVISLQSIQQAGYGCGRFRVYGR